METSPFQDALETVFAAKRRAMETGEPQIVSVQVIRWIEQPEVFPWEHRLASSVGLSDGVGDPPGGRDLDPGV